MFLKYRPIRLEDLPEGLQSIRDRFAYSEAECAQLLEFWRELIVGGTANATLIEDLDRPPGQRFLQFCLIVFLTPEFTEYLQADAPAPIGRAVLNAHLAGERPYLSLAEVRRANSREGVTYAALHSGPSQEILHGPEWPIVGAKITDYSPWAVAGYRVNELFLEVYSPPECAYTEEYGMKRVRETAFAVPGQPDARAHLYHLTRERAFQQVGKASSELFHHREPRFFFAPSEQHLLWCGLYGEADEELAEQLRISLATVKKRWATIYERVAAISPDLLGDRATDARRGGEKKRRLIQYLRHHPEELRPTERPKAARATSSLE